MYNKYKKYINKLEGDDCGECDFDKNKPSILYHFIYDNINNYENDEKYDMNNNIITYICIDMKIFIKNLEISNDFNDKSNIIYDTYMNNIYNIIKNNYMLYLYLFNDEIIINKAI